jgi:hypothetical protein
MTPWNSPGRVVAFRLCELLNCKHAVVTLLISLCKTLVLAVHSTSSSSTPSSCTAACCVPTIPADVLIEEHQKEVRQYPDFTMGAGEPFLHYVKRMCLEGHTYFDAWLISAGAIGEKLAACCML